MKTSILLILLISITYKNVHSQIAGFQIKSLNQIETCDTTASG